MLGRDLELDGRAAALRRALGHGLEPLAADAEVTALGRDVELLHLAPACSSGVAKETYAPPSVVFFGSAT